MGTNYQKRCTYSKCSICKKQISWQDFSKEMYVYKKIINGKTRYACGWSCYQKMLKKYEKPKKISNFDRVINFMADGLSNKEIAEKTGLSLVTVKLYVSKSDMYLGE